MKIIVQNSKAIFKICGWKKSVTTSTTITRKFKIKEMEDQEG